MCLIEPGEQLQPAVMLADICPKVSDTDGNLLSDVSGYRSMAGAL
jgi:hypothetical protein